MPLSCSLGDEVEDQAVEFVDWEGDGGAVWEPAERRSEAGGRSATSSSPSPFAVGVGGGRASGHDGPSAPHLLPTGSPPIRGRDKPAQDLGRAPPRDDFLFPNMLVPPPRSSPLSRARLIPRVAPPSPVTPRQAGSGHLPLTASHFSAHATPTPAGHDDADGVRNINQRQHLSSPGRQSQQYQRSRFAEALPRPSPLSLPAPLPTLPSLRREPSSNSSISPSITLPPSYTFPMRDVSHRRGVVTSASPYHPLVSRFSDWTSTNDSLDSPWDEPFSLQNSSVEAVEGASTSSSGRWSRWSYSAREGGSAADEADAEENGDTTDDSADRPRRPAPRGRALRRTPADEPSPRKGSRPRARTRMVSASTQTTEDLMRFYSAQARPPTASSLASGSTRQHDYAPPPSLSSDLHDLDPRTRPPSHSQSSSSAATWVTSTADTSVQGVRGPSLLGGVGASGSLEVLDKTCRSQFDPAMEKRGDVGRRAVDSGERFKRRMSVFAEWVAGGKGTREARRASY